MSPETQEGKIATPHLSSREHKPPAFSAGRWGYCCVSKSTSGPTVSPALTGRIVLVVGDELRDGVEHVLFCQVILILGGAAHNIVADHALGVSGETVQGVSGEDRCL